MSLLHVHVRIGKIMASNTLRARAVFSLLRFVCRLKLKRAWRAFFLRCSCDTEKFPDEDFRSRVLHLKKVSIRSYYRTNFSSHSLTSYTIILALCWNGFEAVPTWSFPPSTTRIFLAFSVRSFSSKISCPLMTRIEKTGVSSSSRIVCPFKITTASPFSGGELLFLTQSVSYWWWPPWPRFEIFQSTAYHSCHTLK